MSWHLSPLAGFDLETTGVDVETDRIVTAAVIDYTPGVTGSDNLPDHAHLWLADPGIDIPEQASNIHGVTTEKAQQHGRRAVEVVGEVAEALAKHMSDGTPIVAMNGRYDFTLLDRELRRHGLATLEELLGRPLGPVIDPFVLDKQADKFRPGSRKLESLAVHYGITLAAAHTADADALAAIEVAVAIAEKYPELQVAADRVHAWQVHWATQQAASFQAYKRRTDPSFVADPAWPLVPFRDELTQARAELDAMRRVIVGHIGEALANGLPEVQRWAHGVTKELDQVGVNIDAAVDQRMRSLGWTPPDVSEPDAEAPF